MSLHCSDTVKGALGNYCPILMRSPSPAVFCDGNEEFEGRACQVWNMAQKSVGSSIPLAPLSEENIPCSDLQFIDYLLGGRKILAVEDNPVSMKILTKALSDLKPLFLKAKNGKEGLEHIEIHADIGLVLLDLNMPEMNGSEMLDHLFETYGEDLPFTVVLVSELKNWDEAKALIMKGVKSYVKKPYRSDELLYTIRRALFIDNVIAKS
jgi:CheY-like chemotaxis protein